MLRKGRRVLAARLLPFADSAPPLPGEQCGARSLPGSASPKTSPLAFCYVDAHSDVFVSALQLASASKQGGRKQWLKYCKAAGPHRLPGQIVAGPRGIYANGSKANHGLAFGSGRSTGRLSVGMRELHHLVHKDVAGTVCPCAPQACTVRCVYGSCILGSSVVDTVWRRMC